MFAALVAYKEEHGDCNVPRSWPKNPKLGKGGSSQRVAYTKGRLSQDRDERLEAIGVVWDTLDARWEEMFAALVAYNDEHGDCNIPRRWLKNPKLGKWVSTQRKGYAKGKLSQDRIERLEAIGFEWNHG